MEHRRELQAGCFVIDQADLGLDHRGTLSWAQVIGEADQATALSLFYLESRTGISPAMLTGAAAAARLIDSRHVREKGYRIWLHDNG